MNIDKSMNNYKYKISHIAQTIVSRFFSRSLSVNSFMILSHQLSTYIGAGLSIPEALELLSRNTKDKDKQIILNIKRDVESGLYLSSSLLKYSNNCEAYINIIKYGESSGLLSESLRRVYELLKRKSDIKSKCLSALYYPIIISIFALIITFGLIKGIMPQIVPVLTSLNAELPLLTRIVIWISDFISDYGLYFLLLIIFTFIIIKYLYRRYIRFQRFIYYVLHNIPILGSNLFLYHITNLFYSIGGSLNIGLSLDIVVERSVEDISYFPLRDILIRNLAKVRSGSDVRLLFEHKLFPTFIHSLLSAGMVSGTLGDSFINISQILEASMTSRLSKLTGLLEPTMMILLGTIVGAISLSIMLPIYDISAVLQKAH